MATMAPVSRQASRVIQSSGHSQMVMTPFQQSDHTSSPLISASAAPPSSCRSDIRSAWSGGLGTCPNRQIPGPASGRGVRIQRTNGFSHSSTPPCPAPAAAPGAAPRDCGGTAGPMGGCVGRTGRQGRSPCSGPDFCGPRRPSSPMFCSSFRWSGPRYGSGPDLAFLRPVRRRRRTRRRSAQLSACRPPTRCPSGARANRRRTLTGTPGVTYPCPASS